MQQKYQKSMLRFKTAFTGTVWVAGLLLAGSDSPYMPWTNVMGLLLFLGASLLISRKLRVNPGVKTGLTLPRLRKSSGPHLLRRAKKNQRIKIRYALEG